MSDYPQMPSFTEEELVEFLKKPLIGKICSHNGDGTIHIAPMLFKYDNGTIIFGTQDVTKKVHNIRHNTRVTVLVDTVDQPPQGVMMYGTATLEYDDVVEKRADIFSNYMPPEQAKQFATALAQKWNPVVIRFTPDRFVSYDYSKGSLI